MAWNLTAVRSHILHTHCNPYAAIASSPCLRTWLPAGDAFNQIRGDLNPTEYFEVWDTCHIILF